MALDSEQFRQRRAARAWQRQQKADKAKKRRKIALICILGLAACLILIWILSLLGDDSEKKPAAPTEADLTVIHLAAGGDLNITEKTGTIPDYTAALLDVAPLLANADLAALNFEGGLYGEPYGVDASAPTALPQALKSAGLDVVQLANSYTIYQGTSGLTSTINGMHNAGLITTGAWATPNAAQQAQGYTICTVKGVKVAFVSFTKGMDGMALPASSAGCVNLLYKDYSTSYQQVNTEGITQVLQAAAAAQPDVTIALLHWGSEFNDTISSSQERIVSLMQQNGVDAIIGTHSHYVQQMTYDALTGNFVAYSLGDFMGDADRAGSEYSVILDLEITKNNTTGATKITGFSYTPIFTVTDGDSPKVVRIASAMAAYENGYIDKVSQPTYEAMKYALERIEARTSGN